MGTHSELAAHIKKRINIPVATVGRITEPWIAEEMIANGMADACMIGRANLCEPEFANKAKEGREQEIRPCIGCLRCLTGIMFGKRVACTINPSFELINEDTLEPAEIQKNVLVIGGGVAGMEAAFVAKKRGHHVVLCEATEELGGLAKLAAVPIGKQDLTRVIQFMSRRLHDSGVEVRLNTCVTKEMLSTEFKDWTVIAAVGAKANTIPAFTCFKNWMTADDILAGRAFPGQNVVIIGGGSVGCELADFLAPTLNDRFPRNRKVTVLEMAPEIMLTEGGVVRSKLAMRMMEKGVRIECNAKVSSVSADTITFERDGTEYVIKDADTLVFANGYHVDNAMEDMLKSSGSDYRLIGDAAKVGNLKDAISGAYELGKNL